MHKRKVLITGAASGIGRAAAIRFANEGYDVCLNDIQDEKLTQIMQALPNGHHLSFGGSFSQKDIIGRGEALIKENWGALDTLVSCAGIFEETNPIEMDIDRWRMTFDSMVNGCV